MKKILLFLFIVFLASLLFADDSEFRLIVSRNDLAVDGEFQVDLQVRVPDGQTAHTLNSLTADVSYGSGLTVPGSGSIDLNWFSGSADYECTADALTGRYRILITGNDIGQSGAGSPAGLLITTSWQKVVTLRWKITQIQNYSVYIDTDTDAAGYFVNQANNPEATASDWANAPTAPADLKVAAKIFLEGPYESGTGEMTTLINSQIPTTSPYVDGRTVSSIPADATDWIELQLRSIKTGATVSTKSVFLHKDGQIINDAASATETNIHSIEGENKDYYLVINHRNHLKVMSNYGTNLNASTSSSYDFTTAMDRAHGTNPLKSMGDGNYAMISGDGNEDHGIDVLDLNMIWRQENGTAWSYDKSGDFNLDGGIDVLDLNFFWRQNNGTGSQVP